MPRFRSISSILCVGLGLFALTASTAWADFYSQINLVSDIPGLAQLTDSGLKNPWEFRVAQRAPSGSPIKGRTKLRFTAWRRMELSPGRRSLWRCRPAHHHKDRRDRSLTTRPHSPSMALPLSSSSLISMARSTPGGEPWSRIHRP